MLAEYVRAVLATKTITQTPSGRYLGLVPSFPTIVVDGDTAEDVWHQLEYEIEATAARWQRMGRPLPTVGLSGDAAQVNALADTTWDSMLLGGSVYT